VSSPNLLALLDDIATVLDDVAVLTKLAAKKTAGVLGDDLALNAQQVAGVAAHRELPVVWAVAKGSFLNKLILVPAALAISAFLPWAVIPLLMIGGAFLCYEGAEKLLHKLHPTKEDKQQQDELVKALTDPSVDMVAFERQKIRGAIRTDFILSAEIVAITLGEVSQSPFGTRVLVLSSIALLMTVGVYGLVAGIVKIDDAGMSLSRRTGMVKRLGLLLVAAAPYLMKTLSVLGTAAMFLVGGGILAHGIPPIHHFNEAVGAGGGLRAVLPVLVDGVTGVVAGAIIVAVVSLVKRLLGKKPG
jgi:hypothetical protein